MSAEKFQELRRLTRLDAATPQIRKLATHVRAIAGEAKHGDQLKAALCHAVVRDGIRYRSDTERTGGEDIAGITRPPALTPLEPLWRGEDDCDAQARLFVALAIASGLAADLVAHWQGAELDHVSARVAVAGRWLPVELTLARARVGDETPKLTRGQSTTREAAAVVPPERPGQWLLT